MARDFNSLSAEERKAHARKWGAFNDFPPGWRELSEADFAQSNYFTYSPDLSEHRQMLRYIDGSSSNAAAVSAHLHFFWDNTGFAIVNDFWGKKVKFFAFGCDHVYGPDPDYKPQFRTDHGVKCVKCGQLWQYDSSD